MNISDFIAHTVNRGTAPYEDWLSGHSLAFLYLVCFLVPHYSAARILFAVIREYFNVFSARVLLKQTVAPAELLREGLRQL